MECGNKPRLGRLESPLLSSSNTSQQDFQIPLQESNSFDFRGPLQSQNYSNVQVVCRINAPFKAISSTTSYYKPSQRRPNSASRVNFSSALPTSLRAKPSAGNRMAKHDDKSCLHPSRSFVLITSTPTIRSPSFEQKKSRRQLSGGPTAFIPLRSKVKPESGKRLTSGSPVDSSRPKAKRSYGSSFSTNVFTTSLERSNKVIITEIPVSNRVVNDQLEQVSQLDSFLHYCTKNGFNANVYDFDQVFSEVHRQENFYKRMVRPAVNAFIEGEKGTVLLFGPSQSGKTFTLHGKTGKDRGIVPRAVEDVLAIVRHSHDRDNADFQDLSSLIQDLGTDTQPILSVNSGSRFGKVGQLQQPIQVYGNKDYDQEAQDVVYLRVSVFLVYCDRTYDLLSPRSAKKVKREHYIDPSTQSVVSRFSNMTERIVLNVEHYYALMQEAFRERKSIAMKLTDHDIRKRSHLVVSLALVQTAHSSVVSEVARLNFVELCGSEQSVAAGGQARDTSVRQFVTRSFNGLSTQVLKSALGKRQQLEEGDVSLVGALQSTLTAKSNVILVACASPSAQLFEHTLPAVKFCARIRDTIVRKLRRQGMTSRQHLLEESQHTARSRDNLPVKQTRFKLEQIAGPMNTFGRQSQVSEGAPENHVASNDAPAHSSLKKPGSSLRTRSSSPSRMQIDEIRAVQKQLEGEVQLYDALTKEFAKGNARNVDRGEVREWTQRAFDLVNRAILSLSGGKAEDIDARTREESIDALCYLKERMNAIERIVLTTGDRARNASPRLAGSNLDAAKYAQSAHTTATVKSKRDEERFFSNVKDTAPDAYKTYDQRENSGGRTSTKFQSQYGRELSEKYEVEKRRSELNAPQSARDPIKSSDIQPLRNFSRSGSRGRLDVESGSPDKAHAQSPSFLSGQNIVKKQSLVANEVCTDFPRKQSPERMSSALPTAREANFTRVRDVTGLKSMEDKFLSSQRIAHMVRSTFGEAHTNAGLYSSAEETLSDIQRLIMLEDYDGLRRRVVQLFKERQICDETLRTRDIELGELREQLDVRDQAVRQIEQLNERNIDEYMRAMSDLKQGQQMEQSSNSLHLRNLQETIDAQTLQLEQLKQQRQGDEEKMARMQEQLEQNSRVRIEAEATAHRLKEENAKLYTNYDVLKEHELNIIKDFQDKRSSDQRQLDDQIRDLRRQIEDRNNEIQTSRRQICDLEGELRKQEFETLRLSEQRTLQSDAQELVETKLQREQADNGVLRDKIADLEKEVEAAKAALRTESHNSKCAYNEVKQLQDLVAEMETTIQRLSEELKDAKTLTVEQKSHLHEMETQRKVFEEKLAVKDREISGEQEQRQQILTQLQTVQAEFNALERNHIKLRAAEFDKVDVLKVNAELEGRAKNLQIDVENLIRERNNLREQARQSTTELEGAREEGHALKAELEYYRRTHEAAMDKFDRKFSEFQIELAELTDANLTAKEREKKLKRQVSALEVENLQLKEKFKYANQRNIDLTGQVEFVEKDMQKLARETGEQVAMQVRTVEQTQRRAEATDKAFTDIKSMIKDFRKDRQTSKEARISAMQSQRDATSPDSQAMTSSRRDSSSPSEWKRRRISPQRSFR